MIDTIKVLLTIEVNTETNESKVIGRELVNTEKTPTKRAVTKKTVKDDDPVAKLILEDNKYRFNSAAIDLMGIEPDNKIDIKYEKHDKEMIPIVGTNEAFGTMGGNRLTKSYTVSCKGKNRERLVAYGDIFVITPHESKAGVFVLTGNAEKVTTTITDDFNDLDDSTEIEAPVVDVDFDELDNNNATEIFQSDFKL